MLQLFVPLGILFYLYLLACTQISDFEEVGKIDEYTSEHCLSQLFER